MFQNFILQILIYAYLIGNSTVYKCIINTGDDGPSFLRILQFLKTELHSSHDRIYSFEHLIKYNCNYSAQEIHVTVDWMWVPWSFKAFGR